MADDRTLLTEASRRAALLAARLRRDQAELADSDGAALVSAVAACLERVAQSTAASPAISESVQSPHLPIVGTNYEPASRHDRRASPSNRRARR